MDPVLVSSLAAIGKNILLGNQSSQGSTKTSSGDFDSVLKGLGSEKANKSSSLDDIRGGLQSVIMELSNNPDFRDLVGGLASGKSASIHRNESGSYEIQVEGSKEFSVSSGSDLYGIVDRLAQLKVAEQSLNNELLGGFPSKNASSDFFITLV